MRDPVQLSYDALKYAAGDLDPIAAEAFELTLARDPAAREALAEAVRLSAAALGQPAPTPDRSFRSLIAERLRPVQDWTTKLFPRKAYRGHPVTWAGFGATLAVTVALGGNWVSPAPTCPVCPVSPCNELAVLPPAPVPAAIPVVPSILPDHNPMASFGGGTHDPDTDTRTNRPSTFLPESPPAPIAPSLGSPG